MIDQLRKILKVFERHKLWDEGAQLIGSWCFYFYQRHYKLENYPLKTQDVDFLLPYPYRGRGSVDLVRELEDLGFYSDFHPNGSIFLSSAELRIDFIVPERGAGFTRAPELKQLKLRAQPLRFMDMLFDHPISIDENGVRLKLPAPEAFCLHKALIAGRRRKTESRLKDLEQSLRTVEACKRSTLKKQFREMPRSWQKQLLRNLDSVKRDLPLLEDRAKKLSQLLGE